MGGYTIDSKFTEELRQHYMKNPPEGMTPRLVKNITDSDLLDMHYFLTEDELDGDEFEEIFYFLFILMDSYAFFISYFFGRIPFSSSKWSNFL